MTVYYLIRLAANICLYFDDHIQIYNRLLILAGITNILLVTSDIIVMTTFFLVVRMMLPITKNDKETRSKFQRFLFNGFADKDELKAAILANNPHMDADQRSLME